MGLAAGVGGLARYNFTVAGSFEPRAERLPAERLRAAGLLVLHLLGDARALAQPALAAAAGGAGAGALPPAAA